MDFKQKIANTSINHYKVITLIMVVITLALGAMIPMIRVDTDPENMLSEEESVRVFHHLTKETFSLSDIVVLGIVNNEDENGVFNPASLKRVYELTQFALKELQWEDTDNPGKYIGVKEVDLLAPSTVDHIEQGGPGEIRFEWLMAQPPSSREEALVIRDKALSNPLLKGTLVSEDGKAICLYLPLTSKDLSYRVYSALKQKIAEFSGDEQYFITGLPVAEDTFGVEMFVQMAISAPLAMTVIFLLMLLFFRKLVLVISPLIVAMSSVISTMGLLIGLGYPVHIMSSMIPIFLMPISVVDSVHILSEFFDRYSSSRGRKEIIVEVMNDLFMPMLYTSLTSAAGFASLSLTPIPPVQVFGIFVAIGILLAWVWTILFVPAYIMMISEKSLANFGAMSKHTDGHAAKKEKKSWLTNLLDAGGQFTFNNAKAILIGILIITAIAVYGITRIQINDNPVKWFSKSHPIRQADIELNRHFGGTYMAYLVLDNADPGEVTEEYVKQLLNRLNEKFQELKNKFPGVDKIIGPAGNLVNQQAQKHKSKEEFLAVLSQMAQAKVDIAENDNEADTWYELSDFFDLENESLKIFKQPEVLEYVIRLQQHLGDIKGSENRKLVGKSNSIANVVKKVYQELIDGKPESAIIPDTSPKVAQTLLQYQSSHKPDDLWHLVTPDYMHANIWCQLTSGDNKDMEAVVESVDRYLKDNPPPVPLKHNWAGLTYINTVWQDKMVSGMLQSFMGSFLVVFIMMSILFRSPLWGILCMIPLTVTIALIYGIIGLVGKDYDMPVAVLSSLTLGMAVDFAIHFLERARETHRKSGSWKASVAEMFGEPARAISRNIIVIAIGFLPLLAAPLVPYKTVGIFLCGIMALSGTITLLVLPAVLKLCEKLFFKPIEKMMRPSCACGSCLVISTAAVLLIALSINQYTTAPWTSLALVSIIAIPVIAVICNLISRRKACKAIEKQKDK